MKDLVENLYGKPDPMAFINLMGLLARPAKGLAAMTGLAPPAAAPWLEKSIIPEKYNYPYGAPQREIEADQHFKLGEQFLGGVGNIAKVGKAVIPGIKAYHGSPHDFDRFDLSKIGTGEGAQAYGHGLYFAEKEGVAQVYREALARHPAQAWLDRFNNIDDAIEAAKRGANTNFGRDNPDLVKMLEAHKTGAPLPKPTGKMYEVNLRAKPEEFLDWDKPLSAQGAVVDKMRSAGYNIPKTDGDTKFLEEMAAKHGPDSWYALQLNSIRTMGQRPGGEFAPRRTEDIAPLRDAGIPGIKYLDQGSRAAPSTDAWVAQQLIQKHGSREAAAAEARRLKSSDEVIAEIMKPSQTHNYVLFRDDIIDILRKYGIPGLGVAGAGALGADHLSPPKVY